MTVNPRPRHRYPVGPGYTNNTTSLEAALKVEPAVTSMRGKVLAFIRARGHEGATPDEIASALNMLVVTARPRTTELARVGLVVDSHQRRRNENGNNSIVYIAIARPGTLD